MPLGPFTMLHVLVSLAGIMGGLCALIGFAQGRLLPRTTALFLFSTVATTITGFLFPFRSFTPAIGVGIISSIVLVAACIALYGRGLRGGARITYAITAVVALYLNMVVLIVQSFQKVPLLHRLAPQGSEPPFLAAQGVLFISAIALGSLCLRAARHPSGAS